MQRKQKWTSFKYIEVHPDYDVIPVSLRSWEQMESGLASGASGDGVGRIEGVEIESVPYGLMPEMASLNLDGDIAGFICPAPFGDAGVAKKGFRHLLLSRNLWCSHPGSVLAVHPDLTGTHGAELSLLVSFLLDSARKLDRYIRLSPAAGETEDTDEADTAENHAENDSDVERLSASFLEIAPGHLKRTLATSGISYCPELLALDMKILNILIDYMRKIMGIMPVETGFDKFDRGRFVRPEFI